ncbi:MAG: hypothetical protein EBR99_08085, partial [Actinobacteria bacterium]|nr:hypothetical protein [Actinomycetota bacterium]
IYLAGSGAVVISGAISGGNYTQTGGFNRAGTGTVTLTGTNQNVGRWQADGGSIRVSTGANLGSTTISTGLYAAGGFFEIRTDAGNTFSTLNAQFNNTNAGILIDRGIAGTGSLGQTVIMGALSNNTGINAGTIVGRDGLNLLATSLAVNGTGTSAVLASKLSGLLQIGSLTYASGTSITSQINAYGDILVTGNLTGTGATTPVYSINSATSSRGQVTMLGSSTLATSALRLSDGTMAVASSAAVDSLGLLFGSSSSTAGLIYLGAGGGALYGGTGAGETWAKPFTVNSSASLYLFASQAGSAPTALNITGTFTNTSGTTNTLYFGGFNTSDNTMTSVIANNASNAFNVGKTGIGTWVFAGNNTYTGTTS